MLQIGTHGSMLPDVNECHPGGLTRTKKVIACTNRTECHYRCQLDNEQRAHWARIIIKHENKSVKLIHHYCVYPPPVGSTPTSDALGGGATHLVAVGSPLRCTHKKIKLKFKISLRWKVASMCDFFFVLYFILIVGNTIKPRRYSNGVIGILQNVTILIAISAE